jgi:hypothetical protein
VLLMLRWKWMVNKKGRRILHPGTGLPFYAVAGCPCQPAPPDFSARKAVPAGWMDGMEWTDRFPVRHGRIFKIPRTGRRG